MARKFSEVWRDFLDQASLGRQFTSLSQGKRYQLAPPEEASARVLTIHRLDAGSSARVTYEEAGSCWSKLCDQSQITRDEIQELVDGRKSAAVAALFCHCTGGIGHRGGPLTLYLV